MHGSSTDHLTSHGRPKISLISDQSEVDTSMPSRPRRVFGALVGPAYGRSWRDDGVAVRHSGGRLSIIVSLYGKESEMAHQTKGKGPVETPAKHSDNNALSRRNILLRAHRLLSPRQSTSLIARGSHRHNSHSSPRPLREANPTLSSYGAMISANPTSAPTRAA